LEPGLSGVFLAKIGSFFKSDAALHGKVKTGEGTGLVQSLFYPLVYWWPPVSLVNQKLTGGNQGFVQE